MKRCRSRADTVGKISRSLCDPALLLKTGQELPALKGGPQSVRGVAFSPDGKKLAVVGNYGIPLGQLAIWDTTAGPDPASS